MNILHFELILSIIPALICAVGKYYDDTTSSHFVDITVHPQSVNTTLNSTVNFTCEAVADLIAFRVNDISAAIVNIVNRGFNQQLIDALSGGRLRRELLAVAFQDNNNTNISCRAINSEIVYSEIAVLRIQGELML